jgi:hypothetical protein
MGIISHRDTITKSIWTKYDEDDEAKVSNKVDEKQILNLITVFFNQFTNGVSEKIKLEL